MFVSTWWIRSQIFAPHFHSFVSINTDEHLEREADFRCEASVVKYFVKGILNINWADKEEKNISCQHYLQHTEDLKT